MSEHEEWVVVAERDTGGTIVRSGFSTASEAGKARTELERRLPEGDTTNFLVLTRADAEDAMTDYRMEMAGVVQRAIDRVGWSPEDLATRIDVPVKKVERWLTGADRPHFERLLALDELRWIIIVELAKLARLEVVENDEGVTITSRKGGPR